MLYSAYASGLTLTQWILELTLTASTTLHFELALFQGYSYTGGQGG